MKSIVFLENPILRLGAALFLFLVIYLGGWQSAQAMDVPLWDGETIPDPAANDTLINRYGGSIASTNNISQIILDNNVVHSGQYAYRATLPSSITSYPFFQLGLSDTSKGQNYIIIRDMSYFNGLRFYTKNELNLNGTPTTFNLEIEIKDINNNRKYCNCSITSDSSSWQLINPPPFGNWETDSGFDLTQARYITFKFLLSGSQFSGQVYFDDVVLVEGDLPNVVEQIARRHFFGLWGSRSRSTGLIPMNSVFANIAALNCTAAVVKLLPVACKQWGVTQQDANDYVGTLVKTLDSIHTNKNWTYQPPRYVDWYTLAPTYLPQNPPNVIREESSVDAAYMALALYQYMNSQYNNSPLPTSDLQSQIDSLLAKFNFAPFGSQQGWRMAYYAYKDGSSGFTTETYDGYSGEIWSISLAAHLIKLLNQSNGVDIATYYNTGTKRLKTSRMPSSAQYVVHSDQNYRAPFVQWLFSLFVKLDNFLPDTYTDPGKIPSLATNPLQNAIRYQQDVDLYLQTHDPYFLQPDAGDDGSGNNYQQFSCYNNFGERGLFMPWSVAFALLGDPSIAGPALSKQLTNGFHGPLGLSDSVQWKTSAAGPYQITARHDFWNVSLSTMAMVAFLYPQNYEFLSNLPEVQAALRKVYPARMGGNYLLLLLN